MTKMINCKTCGQQIAKSAKICPHCGAKNNQGVPVVLIVVLAILFLGLIGSIAGKESENSENPNNQLPQDQTTQNQNSSSGANTQRPSDQQPADTQQTNPEPEFDIEVNATGLLHDFDTNSISAESTYKGKKTKITGIVGNIGRDVLNSAYVTLINEDDQWAIISVQCYFKKSDEDAIASLHPGDTVSIIGEYSDSTLNITFKKCKLAA